MSAVEEKVALKARQLSQEVTAPLPGSRRIYVPGSRDDIQVPMRLVQQSSTAAAFGAEQNPDITVYDTSGPYTDPNSTIDLEKGLPALRADWIGERADTEELAGLTSAYGRERLEDDPSG